MSIVKSDGSGFDPREYRKALGCFGTGVCLISTRDGRGRARAITANSFSSVSLKPPMILWCIDESSDRLDLYMEAEYFGVNFLRSGSEAQSTTFARNIEAELTGEELTVGQNGIPLYTRALGHIECRTAWRQKAGDHIVIFGSVIGYDAQDGDALGFFKGRYSTISTEKA